MQHNKYQVARKRGALLRQKANEQLFGLTVMIKVECIGPHASPLPGEHNTEREILSNAILVFLLDCIL